MDYEDLFKKLLLWQMVQEIKSNKVMNDCENQKNIHKTLMENSVDAAQAVSTIKNLMENSNMTHGITPPTNPTKQPDFASIAQAYQPQPQPQQTLSRQGLINFYDDLQKVRQEIDGIESSVNASLQSAKEKVFSMQKELYELLK